jgi:hypothetical protein
MLVCANAQLLAHETAGAACTRHSLRPLLSEGHEVSKARTQNRAAGWRIHASSRPTAVCLLEADLEPEFTGMDNELARQNLPVDGGRG